MRKWNNLCLLVMFLVLAGGTGKALAADVSWYSGVYVAPKLTHSHITAEMHAQGNNTREVRNDKSDDDIGGGLAIGYDFDKRFDVPIRAEFEYVYIGDIRSGEFPGVSKPTGSRIATFGSQKTDIQTLFLNAYYDIETGTMFTPYVGGGIGMAMFSYSDSELGIINRLSPPTIRSLDSGHSTNFAWNIGAGLAWILRIGQPLILVTGL